MYFIAKTNEGIMNQKSINHTRKNRKMIYSTVRELMGKKSQSEKRRITYRVIAKETGLSTGAIVRLCDFNGVKKIDSHTIETLCDYFRCNIGDLLKIWKSPMEKGISDPYIIAGTEFPNDFPIPEENK